MSDYKYLKDPLSYYYPSLEPREHLFPAKLRVPSVSDLMDDEIWQEFCTKREQYKAEVDAHWREADELEWQRKFRKLDLLEDLAKECGLEDRDPREIEGIFNDCWYHEISLGVDAVVKRFFEKVSFMKRENDDENLKG